MVEPNYTEPPKGDFDLTFLKGDKVNKIIYDLGELTKENFSYLGPWQYEKYQNGTGWAFRLGIKENITDSEGDPATLFVLFPVGLTPKGTSKEGLETKLKNASQTAIEKIALAAVRTKTYDNVLGLVLNPPEYMLKELREILK